MSKVLIVGWDGATFDMIHPLVSEGKLPNLARMMQEGSWGTLHSIVPPVTPGAWTSFFTGKNPGKHGIYDFQDLDPITYTFKPVQTDRHREKTLWHLLGEQNLRALIFDVPYTYPPQPLHGWMLTGYGTPRTPDTVFTSPPNLADLLPPDLRGEVRIAQPLHRFDRSPAFIAEWEQIMAGRRKLLHHLITQEAWDLFMVVFSITDNLAHVFWTYCDPAHPNYHKPEAPAYRTAFQNAYITCDQLLGDLIDAAGPDTITLVLSDHGFGSVRPRQYIQQRLTQGGYLHAPGQRPSLKSQFMRLATETYMRFPFLREWVKNQPPERLHLLRKTAQQTGAAPLSRQASPHAKIILNSFGLSMWVNEQGRFAQGLVPPAEKESLLTELAEFLKADRDPINGWPVIAQVYRGSELYHGPFAETCADLIIEYVNHYRPQTDKPGANPYTEGGHTPNGILLARGTGIRNRAGIAEPPTWETPPSLIDLAPTILHLFGQPIPPDMDGRVLTEILDPAWLATHPVRKGTDLAQHPHLSPAQALSTEEEASIEEQLRRLGYI